MPKRGSWEAFTGLCPKHRDLYYKELYKIKYQFEKLPHRKALRYKIWLRWVKNNFKRRRQLALASYHKRKHLHKDRKHRATKKPA